MSTEPQLNAPAADAPRPTSADRVRASVDIETKTALGAFQRLRMTVLEEIKTADRLRAGLQDMAQEIGRAHV